jgi:hypothetical protein
MNGAKQLLVSGISGILGFPSLLSTLSELLPRSGLATKYSSAKGGISYNQRILNLKSGLHKGV